MSNVNFCFTLEWLVYFYNQKKVANIKKGRMERGRMRRATQRRAGVSTGELRMPALQLVTSRTTTTDSRAQVP